MSKFTCPHCGSDMTRKVQVIYQEGHSTGNFTSREVVDITSVRTTVDIDTFGNASTHTSGGDPIYKNITRSVATTSDLAKLLAPPQEPSKDLKLSFSFIFHFITSIILYAIICLVFALILQLLLEGFIRIIIVYLMGEYLPSFILDACKVVDEYNSLYITPVLAGIMTIILAVESIKEKIKDMKTYKERMKSYPEELDNWLHSYMCMRCGSIFRAEDYPAGQFKAASNTDSLVNSQEVNVLDTSSSTATPTQSVVEENGGGNEHTTPQPSNKVSDLSRKTYDN